MNRKQFILSKGATCRNWTWSWSFINHDEQFVIFGAWDVERINSRAVILREGWASGAKGNRNPGYTQAIEHLGFVNQGYDLYTFNLTRTPGTGIKDKSAIKDFERYLRRGYVKKEGVVWFADLNEGHQVENNILAEELESPAIYTEGAKKTVIVNAYERSAKARLECIRVHGTVCKCCDFDFEKVYGELGKGFIHIRHINPLYAQDRNYTVNPATDLIPLCPNCHAMIHRMDTVDENSVKFLREKINGLTGSGRSP